MPKAEQRLQILDQMFTDAADRGLMQRNVDDEVLNGRYLRFDGTDYLNFSSCSYLGLEMDQRLKEGAAEAAMRYGTQFSSSRSYVSAPAYQELEAALEEIFEGPVMVAASTSLGHLSALPVLVHREDAVIVDQQAHHSMHLAVNQVRVQGTHVELVRHNRMDLLEERIQALRGAHRQIWYMADGVYSMFVDLAPVDDLARLLERYEQFNLYIDDSHGMSWAGRHGRGYVLDNMPSRERMVVAASLNKAFAAAGGAFVFPDAESRRKAQVCGGTMIFSGPIQPPMLGAAVASARIHLSDEIGVLQSELRERVQYCNRLFDEHGLPVIGRSEAPIRYVGMGLPRVTYNMANRLLAEGLFINVARFRSCR